MTDNIGHKLLVIIKSRFKKEEEDDEVKRLRGICKFCEFNTKNLEHIQWNKKVLITISDVYSWLAGKKKEDNLGNCSICTCSVYYKTQENLWEDCPKGYWHNNKNK